MKTVDVTAANWLPHAPHIVMFVMNDLLNDPRIQREARSAVRAGFQVTVVGTRSSQCRVPRETVDGYEVVRVRASGFGVLSALFKFARMASHAGRILKEGAKRVWRHLLGGRDRQEPANVPYERVTDGLLKKLTRYLKELEFLKSTFSITVAMLWVVRSKRAAVFHGNDLPTLPLTKWAARLYGGKTLYDSHELWVGMSPGWTPFFNAIARWVERRYIRQMDAVVTVNDLIAEELRRQYRIPRPTAVMNCPEPVVPRAVDPSYSIRAKLGLSPETPIILYQGRYEPGRGLEELIESARYLSRGVIVLRGYGSNEDDLRDRVATLGVPGRVCMVEPVPMADLVTAASEADVGVVPYTAYSPCYYYASPNKLFEYIMAGLAIAVSNLPVLEKIVRDHDLGVVFDPADPKHIAERLNALVGNPARLRACRENVTCVARNRYNWDHEGGKLISLYRTLAAGNAHPGTTHAS